MAYEILDKQVDPITAALSALLRGELAPWPGNALAPDIDSCLFLARAHGVTPLLDEFFTRGAAAPDWPTEFAEACHGDVVQAAMHELALRAELPRVLAALCEAGVEALILKGTALAYTHYSRPVLRPRGDSDLLIAPEAVKQVVRVFEALGYVREPDSNGEVVSCQATWSRIDRAGVTHCFDVHWRASNRWSLAKAFSYGELASRARRIPDLGPDALGLEPVDALLFACAHRSAHVNTPIYLDDRAMIGGDRLIWLYDIHLLARGMATQEFSELVQRATARKLRAVCLEGLVRTAEHFATEVPIAVLEQLRQAGEAEPSARYLTGRRANQLLGDFRELEDWRTRLRWLKELSFPEPAYMHHRYRDAGVRWLPVLYLRRALEGVGKAVRRRGTGHLRF